MSLLLPKILSESAVLTRNIIQGLHSTRFSGKGEAFWQFNEYRQGDTVSAIDWRKSAASEKFFVKERENETCRDVYFYFDRSKSMKFKSSDKIYSKYYISVLITLALSKIFLRNRENVYYFNKKRVPEKCKHDLSNFNETFLLEEIENNLPETSYIRENSLIFILSDFFYDNKLLINFFNKIKHKNTLGYFIQILDPLEIKFDISENLRLNDMETNRSIIVDDNNVIRKQYLNNLENLKKNLRKLSNTSNWNYLFHDTRKPLKPFLIDIIKNLALDRDKIV